MIDYFKIKILSDLGRFLLASLLEQGAVRFLMLLISGLAASVLQVVAFVFAVKVAISTEINQYLHGLLGVNSHVVMAVGVALILAAWGVATKYYRVSLVDFEKRISLSALKKNLVIQKHFFSFVTSFDYPYLFHKQLVSRYPEIFSSACKHLAMLIVVFFVLLLTVVALFVVNYQLTILVLFILSLVLFVALPKIKRSREMKSRYDDVFQGFNLARQSVLREFDSAAIDSDQLAYSLMASPEYFAAKNAWVDQNKVVEGSALVVNLFSAISVGGLLLWYAVFRDLYSAKDLMELVVLLVLLRFFSSFCSRSFRSVSALNSLFREVYQLYLYRQKYDGGIGEQSVPQVRRYLVRFDQPVRSQLSLEISKLLTNGECWRPEWVLLATAARKYCHCWRETEVWVEAEKNFPELTKKLESNAVDENDFDLVVLAAVMSLHDKHKNLMVLDARVWLHLSDSVREFCNEQLKNASLIFVAVNDAVGDEVRDMCDASLCSI